MGLSKLAPIDVNYAVDEMEAKEGSCIAMSGIQISPETIMQSSIVLQYLVD
jgi:hypothetical protein